MKVLSFFAVLFLVSGGTFAQKVSAESKWLSALCDSLTQSANEETHNEVLIRFWHLRFDQPHQLIVLKYDNKTWTAERYRFCSWNLKNITSRQNETISLDHSWARKWDTLKLSGIFSLKKFENSKKKWRIKKEVSIPTERRSFIIEVWKKLKYQSVKSDEPELILENYIYNHSMDNLFKIIELLNEVGVKDIEYSGNCNY